MISGMIYEYKFIYFVCHSLHLLWRSHPAALQGHCSQRSSTRSFEDKVVPHDNTDFQPHFSATTALLNPFETSRPGMTYYVPSNSYQPGVASLKLEYSSSE